MLRQLIAWMAPRKPEPAPDPVSEAQKVWREARDAYFEAKARGDTRDMNTAHRRVRAAARVAVGAELGR